MAIEASGANTASSTLTALTAGAVNTKGSYTELIASTARESKMITVQITGNSNKRNFRFWLATGAASSEVDVFSFRMWSGVVANADRTSFTFPFTVASGTRISAACSCNVATQAASIQVWLSDDDSYGTSTEATLIGNVSGDTAQGVDVDAGASANTKGSWTEISSSAPHDMDFLVLFVGQSANTGINPNHNFLIDIGTGAASSETVLVSDIYSLNDTNEAGNTCFPIYAPISSGDRVVMRCQSDNTDSNDRIIDCSILGVNITAPAGEGGATQTSYGYFG